MLKDYRFLALLVVFGCVFALVGFACAGPFMGPHNNGDQSKPMLSAQTNVSFTAMLNDRLHQLNPDTCSASCYAQETFNTYVAYKKANP